MAYLQQGIAAGFNALPGDIDLFQDLDAGDGREFPYARVVGSHSPGETVLRGDFSVTFEGDETCTLRFHYMSPAQLKYLNTTYCSGLYYGRVTLQLNLLTATDFDLYNATIIIPRQVNLQSAYDPVGDWYNEVEITVLGLELVA